MEMIDVLKKLQEIAETKPELVKDAVDNVQRTNPTEAMKKCQSDPGLKDFIHEWMGLMGGHFESLGKQEEGDDDG